MKNKRKQLMTLGLLIAGVAIFGTIGVSKQLTTTPNTASATNYSADETKEVNSATTEELKYETQQQKELAQKTEHTQIDNPQEIEQVVSTEQEQTIDTNFQPETSAVDSQLQSEETPTEQYATSQQQVTDTANIPVQQEQTTTEIPSMTLSFAGTTISYQNGGSNGQAVIDANPYGMASTFGGSAVQSGSDNMNTHFIGHNPGVFAPVFNLGNGSQIIVTDASGTPTTYTVKQIIQVDDYGFGINDSVDYYDTIIGNGGGERITLQTCITDTENLIVIAYA